MSRCAAPVTKSHPATSPNTAPATQNECHPWSASHMKRHFQCVEQVKSPANLTKYCACHENLKRKISADTPWMLPPIERRFDDNPRIKSSSRTRRFEDLTRPILETILYCKIQHVASRLFPKMSRSAAPVTKSHPPTSPNTAPATQNECHQWSASNMKPHFQCVEQVKSPSNLTKYCACHENLKLKISADTPWMLPPIERRFDDNPTISDHKIVISHPPLRRPDSSQLGDDFVL